MPYATKEVKISEIIKAAEDNGFEWRGHGSTFDERTSFASRCILEQVAQNLGFGFQHWTNLSDAIDKLQNYLGRNIWLYNDDKATSYEDAVAFVKKSLEPYGDMAITIGFYEFPITE